MLSSAIILQVDRSSYCLFDNFPDIKKIYDEGKTEKCLKKIEALINKEENIKEPALYLYKSMALFKLSQNKEFNEKYPKALKESLKTANKAKVKDINNKLLNSVISM